MNIRSDAINEEGFPLSVFINHVATGLWPVNLTRRFCHREDGPQGRGYSIT
jgi:hypothetical protein